MTDREQKNNLEKDEEIITTKLANHGKQRLPLRSATSIIEVWNLVLSAQC